MADATSRRRPPPSRQTSIMLLNDQDETGGEYWSHVLKIKTNLHDAGVWEAFWTDLKDRLLRRYGNMFGVLKKLTNEYGTLIDFAEFGILLGKLHISIETRVCRQVFEKATNGERVMNLDTLKFLLLGRTIKQMQIVLGGCNARQARIHSWASSFLIRLCLEDPNSASKSLIRFQRRLTVEFIRDFWQTLLQNVPKPASPHSLVDRQTFMKVVQVNIYFGLQPYDRVFMMRMFARNARINDGLPLCDAVALLLLISKEEDRCKKMKLLFDVFDTDFDCCLHWDQLLQMFCCLSRQRPVAEMSAIAVKDVNFQRDLSAQDGVQAFECTRWHLQRGSNLEGDIISLTELWVALEKQPDMLPTLLPMCVNIHSWALDRVPDELDDLDSAPETTSLRKTKGTSSSEPGLAGTSSTIARPNTGNGRSVDMQGTAGGHQYQEEVLVKSSTRQKGVGILSFPELNTNVAVPNDVEFYKNARTFQFQQSLRYFGNKRLAELQRGFQLYDEPELMVGQRSDSDQNQAGGRKDDLNGFLAATTTIASASHPGHPVGLPLPGLPALMNGALQNSTSSFGRSLNRTVHRPGSRSSVRLNGGGSPKSSAVQPAHMGRSASAPTLHSAPTGLLAPSMTGKVALATIGGPPHPSVLDTVPPIAAPMLSHLWGTEAADRYQLVATIKGGVGNHIRTDKGVAYKCQLCERSHTLMADVGKR